jgi:hypothetical protein
MGADDGATATPFIQLVPLIRCRGGDINDFSSNAFMNHDASVCGIGQNSGCGHMVGIICTLLGDSIHGTAPGRNLLPTGSHYSAR